MKKYTVLLHRKQDTQTKRRDKLKMWYIKGINEKFLLYINAYRYAKSHGINKKNIFIG